MKAMKFVIKLAAALTAIAGVLCLVAAYWDKISEQCPKCEQLRSKIPSCEAIRAKIPSVDQVKSKIPSRASLSRMNPFHRAPVDADFADFEDFED